MIDTLQRYPLTRITILMSFFLGLHTLVFAAPPIPGESERCMDTNPIITRLLREIHTHTDHFRTLPKSLYPSVALLKRYRDSGVLHAIKLTEHSAEDRWTTLAIVTPTLANAYFNLAQFSLIQRPERSLSNTNPLSAHTRSLIFGATEWQRYFQVKVDNEPDLPSNIEEILNAEAPFLLEGETNHQRVRDNHLLMLVPAEVDGVPFTLNKLGDLTQKQLFPANNRKELGNYARGYRHYSSYTSHRIRTETLSHKAYWLLVPRTILKDSANGRLWGFFPSSFEDHQSLVETYRDYRLPRALEIATALLAHYARTNDRLCQRVMAMCSDWIPYTDGDEVRLVVGWFSENGIYINCSGFNYSRSGLVCCRALR